MKLFFKVFIKFLFTAFKGMGIHEKTGENWYFQRLSSVMMLGLLPWLFVQGLGDAGGKDYAGLYAWLQDPTNATLLSLTIICVFSHARLGLEGIIEDYIHHPFLHNLAIYCVRVSCKAMMFLGVFAIIYTSFLNKGA